MQQNRIPDPPPAGQAETGTKAKHTTSNGVLAGRLYERITELNAEVSE